MDVAMALSHRGMAHCHGGGADVMLNKCQSIRIVRIDSQVYRDRRTAAMWQPIQDGQ
jgi:hypothetical protein